MNQDEIKQICKTFNIENVPASRNYWLVRTNSGIFFDDFYKNGYISIGWDEFSDIEQLRSEKDEKLKEKISQTYKSEKKPGYILNQIKRFVFSLKKGDMVLIPSENSSLIAFGIITDEIYIKDVPSSPINIKNPKCSYKKRINVNWIRVMNKDKFEPYLRMLLFTHTTVSNIDEYMYYINRTLYPIYLYENQLHFTYHVQAETDISFLHFSKFLNTISNSLNLFDNVTGCNFSNDKLDIKTNLNSPGIIEIIGYIAGGGLALAFINSFIFGGKIDFGLTENLKFSSEHAGLLGHILKFVEEKNKNNQEMLRIKNEYKIQREALKLKAPNEEKKDN